MVEHVGKLRPLAANVLRVTLMLLQSKKKECPASYHDAYPARARTHAREREVAWLGALVEVAHTIPALGSLFRFSPCSFLPVLVSLLFPPLPCCGLRLPGRGRWRPRRSA